MVGMIGGGGGVDEDEDVDEERAGEAIADVIATFIDAVSGSRADNEGVTTKSGSSMWLRLLEHRRCCVRDCVRSRLAVRGLRLCY